MNETPTAAAKIARSTLITLRVCEVKRFHDAINTHQQSQIRRSILQQILAKELMRRRHQTFLKMGFAIKNLAIILKNGY